MVLSPSRGLLRDAVNLQLWNGRYVPGMFSEKVFSFCHRRIRRNFGLAMDWVVNGNNRPVVCLYTKATVRKCESRASKTYTSCETTRSIMVEPLCVLYKWSGFVEFLTKSLFSY